MSFTRVLSLAVAVAVVGALAQSEIEEFEVISSAENPVRKEFDNHTEVCFKQFKSSMVKLAALFLDITNENDLAQQDSKCWVKCVMEKFKFIKMAEGNGTAGAGDILTGKIAEKAESLTPPTKTRFAQNVEKCEAFVREVPDLCSKAFAFAKCVFDSYRTKHAVPVVPIIPVKAPIIISG